MASRVGAFLLVVGMIVFCYRLILCEEAGIAAARERATVHTVRRCRVYSQRCVQDCHRPEVVPNWADGMLGEVFMWVMAASEVAFALTLNQTVFSVVLASSFLVYAICLAVITRRGKPRDAGAGKNIE